MTPQAESAGEDPRPALADAADAEARGAILSAYLGGRRRPAALRGAVLTGVTRAKARLRQADLAEADLRDATLEGGFLAQADLQGARLDGARLRRADFSHARCGQAQFSEADLRDALFEEADLKGAVLRFADLRSAAIECADLQDADLWGAKLTGADLSGALLQRATLREAVGPQADFARADLRGAVLMNADLREARFGAADLRGSTLTDARLDGADFSGANLEDVDLSRCSLAAARWGLARLSRTAMTRDQLGPVVGEEAAGEWLAAAGAYFALERNFSELGAVDAASWAYRRRRIMQKRAAGGACRRALEARRGREAVRTGLTWFGDSVVEWSCGYGESVSRVFASLLASFVLFMFVYAALGSVHKAQGGGHHVTRAIGDLALFSLGGMTNTLPALSHLEPANTFAMFLTSLQTLFGIFLTGLLGFVAGNRIRR